MITLRRRGRGAVAEVPPPRVFWQKSGQAIENKGMASGKERQERIRVRNALSDKSLRPRVTNRVRSLEGLNVRRWCGGQNTPDGRQEEEPSGDTIPEPWAR